MFTKAITNDQKVLKVGLSYAFHNKNNRNGNRRAFSQSFIPHEIALADFVEHVTSGKAWTQGFFNGRARRKNAFISAQTLALDLDENISVDDALAEEFIQKYAFLVHPSPSSTDENPKTRVIFLLSEPVTDVSRWEALQRGLIDHFEHLKPDTACKDAARMFYGSDRKGAIGNLSAVLPLEIAGSLTKNEAIYQDSQYKQNDSVFLPPPKKHRNHRFLHDPGDLPESLIRAVEDALGVHSEPTNHEGFTHKPVACPVKSHEHDDRRPAAFWNKNIHALTCFKCGETYNTNQVATALGIGVSYHYAKSHTTDSSFRQKAELSLKNFPASDDDFTANITTSLRFISDMKLDALLERRGILIKSGIGTGKTQLASKLIAKLGKRPRVLALTHRQTLAENLADRLSTSSEDGKQNTFESYRGLDSTDLRRIERLVICYDSLWKLAAVGETLPKYDLIIIDEIEQFHQHLGGDTMRGSAPERAYRVLCQLVRETPHFLGMDAHLSDISREWLQGLIGKDNVTCIHNHYTRTRGNFTLHETMNTAIRTAMTRISEEKGPVVIATNTRRQAKYLAHIFSGILDHEMVQVIHGGNSNSRDVQAFIRNINNRIKGIKLLIYSPSLGTGVDITTPVHAVVGIFHKQPISPTDMEQMMGRCRNASERHAWIETPKADKTAHDGNWLSIYHRYERNALITGMHCQFDEHGILAITEIQRAMLKLLSKLEAKRNRTMREPLAHFARLIRRAGYDLTFVEGDDEQIRETLKTTRRLVKAHEKESVLTADPVNFEQINEEITDGTCEPELLAGHERFKIEHCVGTDITPEIYDDFETQAKREKLRRFCELLTPDAELARKDQYEAQSGTLLSQRKHRTVRRKLLFDLLTSVWGNTDNESESDVEQLLRNASENMLTSEDIETHIRPYLSNKAYLLKSYLGWREDQSKHAVAILRWLLGRVGLKLQSKQIMVNGERFRVYCVDEASYKKMMRYAKTRFEYREKLATEQNRKITSSALIYSKRGYITLSA